MKGFWMRLKKAMAELNENNDGVGIVEVILILVVLIAIVLIFKNQITTIVNDAFNAINNASGRIIN